MSHMTCETCGNYVYDELSDCYFCAVNLDEDEMHHFLSGASFACSYWRNGDDYEIVSKQR
ncbi:MAG: hypothetical protein E7393_01980 [Ruminococcaceae bacterium]|nr:hypothetical protein [Oscillospiraceae bacterium]